MWLNCFLDTRAWEVALSAACVLGAPQLTSSPFKGRASLSLSVLESRGSSGDSLVAHVDETERGFCPLWPLLPPLPDPFFLWPLRALPKRPF